MSTNHAVSRSDIRPLEFALTVILGGVGAALLSALLSNPWVSVGFALVVMSVVAFLRWRIASEFKDHQSLEAFAEDIYLLGYLLTLAALLGLTPRLMRDDSSLFHVAGMKLFTTVFGLALMMIFRQTARRWAEETKTEGTDEFERQAEVFRLAVARLNQAAGELTGKMEEVAHRFDPDLLGTVAEWSNRAANAFSVATRAFQAVPTSVEPGIQKLNDLSKDLEGARAAVAGLCGALGASAGAAAHDFAKEMGQAGQAVRGLGATVAALQPTVDASREALGKLGAQSLQEVKRIDEVNVTLARIAAELNKVEAALKLLAGAEAKEMSAPVNKLVEALQMAAEKAATSANKMEILTSGLNGVVTASEALGIKLGDELGKPLNDHGDAMNRVHEQLLMATTQMGHVATKLDGARAQAPGNDGFDKELLRQIAGLQDEMRETNTQIRTLVGRIDGAAESEHKRTLMEKLFGRGTGNSEK